MGRAAEGAHMATAEEPSKADSRTWPVANTLVCHDAHVVAIALMPERQIEAYTSEDTLGSWLRWPFR
jgi:hypothetical protein